MQLRARIISAGELFSPHFRLKYDVNIDNTRGASASPVTSPARWPPPPAACPATHSHRTCDDRHLEYFDRHLESIASHLESFIKLLESTGNHKTKTTKWSCNFNKRSCDFNEWSCIFNEMVLYSENYVLCFSTDARRFEPAILCPDRPAVGTRRPA